MIATFAAVGSGPLSISSILYYTILYYTTLHYTTLH